MKNLEIIKSNFGTFKGFSNDYLFQKLKNDSAFSDEKIIEEIDETITSDSVCLDIGANIGIITCYLAKKSKFVFAFEPQETIFNLLNENIKLNNLTNCKTYQFGCYSKSGNFKIAPQEMQDGFVGDMSRGYDYIKSIGSISLIESKDGNIKAVRVDEIIDEQIDFIKVDAEGCDIDALIGCQKIIEKYSPKIICEYGDLSSSKFGRTMDDYVKFCLKNGYKIKRIDQANLFLQKK